MEISPARVDGDLTSLISFGDSAKPSPSPEKGIGDAMVDEGAEALKPCL